MALTINKVILAGRLTAEPDLKQTTNGTYVCSFTVAVDREYTNEKNKQADFINCISWKNNATFISTYFHKGTPICIEGSVHTRTWEDKDGKKRYATEINVERAKFVESKNNAQDFNYPENPNRSEAQADYQELKNDDDLPF